MKKKIMRFLDPISGMGVGCLLASLLLCLSASSAATAMLVLGGIMVGGSLFYHIFFPES